MLPLLQTDIFTLHFTKGELIKVLLPDGKEEVLPFKIPKGSNENYPRTLNFSGW